MCIFYCRYLKFSLASHDIKLFLDKIFANFPYTLNSVTSEMAQLQRYTKLFLSFLAGKLENQ